MPTKQTLPAMAKPVAAIFADWPQAALALRELVFDVAQASDVGALTETLKWGQPAYLTEASKSGTTVRLGHVADAPAPLRVFVHCQTNLVDRYRDRFADVLTFDGARAICLPLDFAPVDVPLRHCIAMALTYHRDKRA